MENQLRELDIRIELQDYLRPTWMKMLEKSDCFRQSERILGGLEKLNKTHQFVWIHANNFGYV